MSDYASLSNQFLIAMPSLADPDFERSVTLICEHTAEGALGLIINKSTNLNIGEVFDQLDLDHANIREPEQPVMHGGPVATNRGFVLHDDEEDWESTLRLGDDLALTTSRDILAAIASGKGPEHYLFALGYAGWTAGQLEAEMAENAWLSVQRADELIFEAPLAERWHAATRLLGIDPERLSTTAGHS